MDRVKLEQLQPDETGEVSILLSHAYISTPLTYAINGDPSEEQLSFLEAMFKNSLLNKPGRVIVAKDGARIVGVMRMAKWPDCQKPSGGDSNRLPGETEPRMNEWRKVWAEHDPKKPHWHLGPIGVLPEMQGKGIGSLLLEHFCDFVDELGMAAYLETDHERNVLLYRRYGFDVVGEAMVISIPNWFMWRNPRSL